VSSYRLSPQPILDLRRSAVGEPARAPCVTVAERSDISLCSVLARKGATAQAIERAREEFGVELPLSPRCIGGKSVEFIWAGPNQWFALKQGYDGRSFEKQLRSLFGETASLVDQSDGRTMLRISGPRARDVLAKGVHIDLHPSAFKPGDTATTAIAYINVLFWQVDEGPTYDVIMFRSYAVAFRDWLETAAAEFDANRHRDEAGREVTG
jgi:methylglutamate dehydrogenase subunit D